MGDLNQHHKNISENIRKRGVSKERYANNILWLIFFFICLGITLFVIADSFSKPEFKNEKAAYAYGRSQDIASRIMKEIKYIVSIKAPSLNQEYGERKMDSLILNDSALLKVTTTDVINKALQEEDNYSSNYSIDSKNDYQKLRPKSDLNFLSPISSRAIIAVLLLFIIHFLIKIYRYNIKLGNSLYSKADAIDFCLADGKLKFAEVSRIFSTDNIDLEEPKIPYDKIIELVKENSSKCCCCKSCKDDKNEDEDKGKSQPEA